LLQLALLPLMNFYADKMAVAADDVTYFPKLYYESEVEGKYLGVYRSFIVQLQLPSFLEISLTDENVEGYRFMLMPAFSSTIIIQVIKEPDNLVIADAYEVARDSSSFGRTVPFRLRDGHIRLTVKESKFIKFSNFLDEGGFWELYHFGWGSGLDTSTWVIEGVKDGQHHFFSSSDPVLKKIEQAIRYMHENVMNIPFER